MNYRIYFPKKGVFFIELYQLTENGPRELTYLIYFAVLSQFEAIPRKPQHNTW